MTAREDRGVQVEARTLSGVHIGQQVTVDHLRGVLLHVAQWPASVYVILNVHTLGDRVEVAPTDLVTLTDGGAES